MKHVIQHSLTFDFLFISIRTDHFNNNRPYRCCLIQFSVNIPLPIPIPNIFGILKIIFDFPPMMTQYRSVEHQEQNFS